MKKTFLLLVALLIPSSAIAMPPDVGMLGAPLPPGISTPLGHDGLAFLPLTHNLKDSTGELAEGTFTRASGSTRINPDTGLLETLGNNEPCFEADGLQMLAATVTNLIEYSEDFTQWTNSNTTDSADAIGPEGATNSATTITATDANGTIKYPVTADSTAYNYSIFLKRKTGTGDIDLSLDDGSTWTTKTLTSEWQRFSVNGTQLNPVVGIRIVTSGDEVYAFGGCLTATGYIPPYIPTNGAQVSIAPESVSWALTPGLKNILSDAEGNATSEGTIVVNVGLDGDYIYNHYGAIISSSTSPHTLGYVPDNSLNINAYDGTNFTSVTTSEDVHAYALSFSKSGNFMFNGYQGDSGWVFDQTPAAYDGSFSLSLNLTIGALGNDAMPIYFKNVIFIPRALSTTEIQQRFK